MRDRWQYHLKKTAGLCKKKAKRFVKLRRSAGEAKLSGSYAAEVPSASEGSAVGALEAKRGAQREPPAEILSAAKDLLLQPYAGMLRLLF